MSPASSNLYWTYPLHTETLVDSRTYSLPRGFHVFLQKPWLEKCDHFYWFRKTFSPQSSLPSLVNMQNHFSLFTPEHRIYSWLGEKHRPDHVCFIILRLKNIFVLHISKTLSHFIGREIKFCHLLTPSVTSNNPRGQLCMVYIWTCDHVGIHTKCQTTSNRQLHKS